MIERTGIATKDALKKVSPSKDRLEKGPCVIVECFQCIPCDPCVDACVRGAIKIESNINNLPEVDFDKCNGCGLCISHCPGLAIFVVHKNYSEDKGLVMLPYEFTPIPEKGDMVDALGRDGKKLCDAKVVKVINTKKQDRTAIISILVPKDLVMEVRQIRCKK